MKSFIYLDQYKMYSLSSQLMEGVTDYILKESSSSRADSEQQKGKVASGKLLGEIVESASANVEKKFLHDYAYSLFESRLLADNKIYVLDKSVDSMGLRSEVGNCKLVKIKARAKFIDYQHITATLKGMSLMAKSLEVVTTNDDREELVGLIKLAKEDREEIKSKGGASVAKLEGALKQRLKAEHYGDQLGNDAFFQTHLSHVIEHGFKHSLDFSMVLDSLEITADLNRENLRESIDSIVKKYSRISEVEFVMLGVITQCGIEHEISSAADSEVEENMKVAVGKTISVLTDFEKTFFGRSDNEVIVDPIAIYIEL
ncbi:hypothetical protein V2J76_24300 [Pseudomonas alliivorans]|nr:hypothetical protein [Pseudomonas alliivorans]